MPTELRVLWRVWLRLPALCIQPVPLLSSGAFYFELLEVFAVKSGGVFPQEKAWLQAVDRKKKIESSRVLSWINRRIRIPLSVSAQRDRFFLRYIPRDKPDQEILDIGCGKGFLLADFQQLLPEARLAGIDISGYAIAQAMPEVKPFLQEANAVSLPYPDHSFDLVVSINTLHNLRIFDLEKALQEIERVARKGSFITVDTYRNDDEKERMLAWNLTGLTIMHVDEWKTFFRKVGYTGDYYWFMP